MQQYGNWAGKQNDDVPLGHAPGFSGITWLICLLVCIVLVGISFVYLDVPVAVRFDGWLRTAEAMAKGFGSPILLGTESGVALTLVCIRIIRGHLPRLGEVTGLACLASICAYAVNDSILKVIFGVPDPGLVLNGTAHVFNILNGSKESTFPSGHMMLAGAFAGVFMRLYRRSTLPMSALLLVGMVLLVVGDWHFISDVIAGTFLGVSAGLLAGEVWLAHSRQA